MSAKDTLERHWRAGKQLNRPGWQFREGIQLWHGCWYGCVRWNWQLSEMYLNIEPFISIHYISIRSIKNNYASNFLTRHQKLDPDDRWGLNYFNSDQKRPLQIDVHSVDRMMSRRQNKWKLTCFLPFQFWLKSHGRMRHWMMKWEMKCPGSGMMGSWWDELVGGRC